MTTHLERASALIQQRRFTQAVEELRLELAEDPNSGYAHASLALLLAGMNQLTEAEFHARQAVHVMPDADTPHYALAYVLDEQKRYIEAGVAITEAIRLDPEDAASWGLLSAIRIHEVRWMDALEAADRGLQLDPKDVNCINNRATALRFLGRNEDEMASLEAALAQNPENAFTHQNIGWGALLGGDRKRAQRHFTEALRLDPNLEEAREGLCSSIKSANPVYGWFLRASHRSARKGRNLGCMIWLVLLGSVWVSRSVAKTVPALQFLETVAVVALIGYLLLSWHGGHFMDFLLQFHPLGRHAVARRMRWAANLVMGTLATSVMLLGFTLAPDGEVAYLGLLFGALVLFITIPLSAAFKTQQGRARTALASILAICVFLLLASIVMRVVDEDGLFIIPWFLCLLLCIASSWLRLRAATSE